MHPVRDLDGFFQLFQGGFIYGLFRDSVAAGGNLAESTEEL